MQLVRVIAWQLAETPMSYEVLQRWVRIQWPRIMPAAIDAALTTLARSQFIECRADRKWRISRAT